MMKNTDMFYSRAREYQDKRAVIISSYEKRLQALESSKGSQYYTDETKKAGDGKDEALKALKNEYGEYFRAFLDAMSKANASRQMEAPTEEELRILQMLKIKDKPTEAELQAAANALKGNATCLAILTEISHNAGYLRGYTTNYSDNKEMSVDVAEETIKGLYSSVRDFMDFDTPRAARIAEKHNVILYGTRTDAPPLPKRRLFENKAECFDVIGGLSGEVFSAFCRAVD